MSLQTRAVKLCAEKTSNSNRRHVTLRVTMTSQNLNGLEANEGVVQFQKNWYTRDQLIVIYISRDVEKNF